MSSPNRIEMERFSNRNPKPQTPNPRPPILGSSIQIPNLSSLIHKTIHHNRRSTASQPHTITHDFVRRELQSSVLLLHPEMFIVNKPAGLAVQGGSKTGRHLDRMLHALVPDGDPAPLLVHRLDRETSGCMAVGRTRCVLVCCRFLARAGPVVSRYGWGLGLGG